MNQNWDVAVLGGGAAGLMAAIEAGRRGRRTIVLDHADRIGKKIHISGGGRCNFTNLGCQAENFLSGNPHFAKSALAAYTPQDFIVMVERHRIPFHEKTLGQLFCDRSSKDIVSMLEREATDADVEIRTGIHIQHVQAGFRIQLADQTLEAESLIVATGGLSIPKMGATGLGYAIAEQFGHKIVTCRPGLVPLTFTPADRDHWCDLAGLSALVTASPGSRKAPAFREKLLVTHRGLSGPAVLQASSYWRAGEAVTIDLAPGMQVFAPLLEPAARRDQPSVAQALRAALPSRFADRWSALHQPARWTNSELSKLERAIHSWQVTPAGDEGYSKAEVTVGGIDTVGLQAKTMESRLVPSLYFVGEVVDVTGWLGGYNFQWAWASGAAAGRAA